MELELQAAIQQLLEGAKELINEHWLKAMGILAFTIVTSFWGAYRARRAWKKRQDMGVLHISQNTIEIRKSESSTTEEKWLILDVHTENQLKHDIEHPVPRSYIIQSANNTTVKNPLLAFPETERWYILNAVRMRIAEQFVYGTAAKLSRKAKFDVIHCVFALTYERYPGMKQGKIRVMIIRKDILEDPKAFEGDFHFESPSHSDRIETLLLMQQDYLLGEKSIHCMDVRINIQL